MKFCNSAESDSAECCGAEKRGEKDSRIIIAFSYYLLIYKKMSFINEKFERDN
jgi:hypothetical protein